MNREERLRAIAKVNASMPSDYTGGATDEEIAILDKLVELGLTGVEKTK